MSDSETSTEVDESSKQDNSDQSDDGGNSDVWCTTDEKSDKYSLGSILSNVNVDDAESVQVENPVMGDDFQIDV
jgi:hypothetical protein